MPQLILRVTKDVNTFTPELQCGFISLNLKSWVILFESETRESFLDCLLTFLYYILELDIESRKNYDYCLEFELCGPNPE